LAYGELRNRVAEAIQSVPFNAEFKHTNAGWIAGIGIETPVELFGWFGKNWIAKTDYLYVDLGKVMDTYTFQGWSTPSAARCRSTSSGPASTITSTHLRLRGTNTRRTTASDGSCQPDLSAEANDIGERIYAQIPSQFKKSDLLRADRTMFLSCVTSTSKSLDPRRRNLGQRPTRCLILPLMKVLVSRPVLQLEFKPTALVARQ
jgi:hypothetical protein